MSADEQKTGEQAPPSGQALPGKHARPGEQTLPRLTQQLIRSLFQPALLAVILNLWLAASIWQLQYIPFQDHPSHLLRENILLHYSDPGSEYPQHFILNLGLVPNQLSDLLVVGLAHLMPLAAASKLFFAFYLIALPLAALFLIRSFRPENSVYVLFYPLVALNYFVRMSNENYVISIPFFLLFIAYWYRTRQSTRWRDWIIGALLATAIYYSHMVAFATAAIVVCIIALYERHPVRRLVRHALLFAPGLLIYATYFVYVHAAGIVQESHIRSIHPYASLAAWYTSLLEGIEPGTVRWLPLVCRIPLFYLPLAALVLAGLAMSWRQRPSRPLAAACTVLIFIAAVLPDWFIIWGPGQRILLLTLLLLPALFPSGQRWKIITCSLFVVFALLLRVSENDYLVEHSKTTAHFAEPFRNIPPGLKPKRNQAMPVVFFPYNGLPATHRVFEYYNLINGGVNPHHIVFPDYTVRYRNKLPATGMYEQTRVTDEMLRDYDVVLLIGRDCPDAQTFMQHLVSTGWKEASHNDVTSVFVRP